MKKFKLFVKRSSHFSTLPAYAHPGDAGMDLTSIEDVFISSGTAKLIHTGISIQLPEGTEAQIRPRSGLALKHSISVLNSPGTIDEGYRGEIGVILINHGKNDFHVEIGMKIAQMVIKPVLTVAIEEKDELTDTIRGQGGFGSTGIKY